MDYNPFKSETRNKYRKHGAYHWDWYKNKKSYRDGVNIVKEWITEKNALDVGAGDGLIAHVLGIRGVDIDRDGIVAALTMNMVVDFGDAINLPYKDEEFDAVLMYDVLEHLEFPLKALAEARRVLKIHLYVVVPSHEGDFVTTENGLKEMIENTGFVLEGKVFSRGVNGSQRQRQFFAKFKKI